MVRQTPYLASSFVVVHLKWVLFPRHTYLVSSHPVADIPEGAKRSSLPRKFAPITGRNGATNGERREGGKNEEIMYVRAVGEEEGRGGG